MELVSLAKEVFQNIAEQAASYRMGQSALRYIDRTLWVIEKCARWAVPPPYQDERPQPELVRPLPWVFFLAMLVTLRLTREGISLLNLVMGKPPLRSADVVMYIQSKRRYLRTLKYQGNRMMRARTSSAQPPHSWSHSISQLFEFTMCFRRHTNHYGNNNTTRLSNNDEVLVVKRSKRGREQSNPAATASETTMERLIEKMMVDLDADSDEDSSFTLTNVTSPKSDRSDFTTESDQDTLCQNNIHKHVDSESGLDSPVIANISKHPCSTPEARPTEETPVQNAQEPIISSPIEENQKANATLPESPSKIPRTPNNEQKIANGRTVKSVPSKKKGSPMSDKDRRNSDLHGNNTSANNTM
ncbi:uncharacterized protein LOC113503662 isoform X2 [Trichoplusia ni]|uniref:Uncharacterized protein LOC113503662 isoform X2 n=1 Tax=Trichoplusia ni TaxID=7111 RepID=A0A7E5WL93_TRINI|nr:uncharacterized protein LOC113503662 isoform X2 [Trichoplusia ni]